MFVNVFQVGLATLGSLSVLARGRATTACNRTYTVKPGDICLTIASQNNAPTAQIIAANPGVIDPNCLNLVPGEVICLGLVGSDCNQVEVVVEGDTCATVAARGNITVASLLAKNSNIDANCDNIFPDETLCVGPLT